MQAVPSSWVDIYPHFEANNYYLGGAVALSQGFLLVCMMWSALTIFIVDRQYLHASVCLYALAILSWIGIIHAFKITDTGIENLFVGQDGKWIAAPGFVISYAIFGVGLTGLWAASKFLHFWGPEEEMETRWSNDPVTAGERTSLLQPKSNSNKDP